MVEEKVRGGIIHWIKRRLSTEFAQEMQKTGDGWRDGFPSRLVSASLLLGGTAEAAVATRDVG